MSQEAKLTSKGQITIPKKIRDELGVAEGDKLRFEHHKGVMTICAGCSQKSFRRVLRHWQSRTTKRKRGDYPVFPRTEGT